MPTGIDDFTESEIRRAILNKAPLERINKSGKHWKGYIQVDGILVGKVKIPNDHNRVMKPGKSQYIARDLQLSAENFNAFVSCTLSGPQYYRLVQNT
jgi:hypothetical protein